MFEEIKKLTKGRMSVSSTYVTSLPGDKSYPEFTSTDI